MDPVRFTGATFNHGIGACTRVCEPGRLSLYLQVIVAVDMESPSYNVLFSRIPNTIGIRVVKRGHRHRGSLALLLDLEIIGLAAVVVEVAISADPDFVFAPWIRRVVEFGNGEATGSCLQN